MIYDKIYKRTESGAIQQWWAETDGPKWRAHYGQIDGAITTSKWVDSTGTNLGKKNERDSTAQATFEVEAEYRKKLAQGRYVRDINDVDNAKYFAPMLAYPVKKYPITDEVISKNRTFSQPKLDGVRGVASVDGIFTRKGKRIVAVPHVEEQLKKFFCDYPDAILDGELYNHDLRDHLNRISGLCRKTKLTESEYEESKIIQYHIYDIVMDQDETWVTRKENLVNIYKEYFSDCPNVKLVDSVEVVSTVFLDDMYTQYMMRGYEGQMIRFDAVYKNSRSRNLLKRKEFTDEEFEIVDIIEGVGNRAGMAGAIAYKTKDGKEFRSGIAGGEAFYKKLWENREKYIGGVGNVRWFRISEYGVPLLPVTHDVFEGEREI